MVWFTPNFKNIKISISGCIQDSERTRHINIGQDFITTQTFSQPLDYALAHAASAFGALGIKVWIIK
jgi:ribosomal protein S3